MRIRIKEQFDLKGMAKHNEKAMNEAVEKASIQMLDWMASGSKNCHLIPPRLTGVLASSGSVFFKNKLIALSPDMTTEGQATPNKNHSGKYVTWGFNTDYATEMHEATNYSPGHISSRLPGSYPGNFWVREHLIKDKKDYFDLIQIFLNKFI